MLAIEAVLRTGRYDAASLDPAVPEWPPHPARLFNALVASAESEEDFAVLETLERLGHPTVHAARRSDTADIVERSYVVANAVDSRGGGSLTWPGRTNALRQRAGVAVREPAFALTWQDAELPGRELDRLAAMASRVPYVGRVTSEATVRIADGLVERELWAKYEPVGLDQPGIMLRVPYPGYVAELRAAYEDGRRAHEVFLPPAPYRPEQIDSDAGANVIAVDGPFADFVVFGFKTGQSLAGDRVVQVTSMLRRAVFERLRDDLPEVVSGHGADGKDHLAFLALPNVGYKHSDGRLLGAALALPRTLVGQDRRRLLGAVVTDPIQKLTINRTTAFEVDVVYDPSRDRPFGLRPERWTSRHGARSWVTATPLMLDRFPKGKDDPARLVLAALATAGFPEADVQVSPGPLAVGAMHRPRAGTLPEKRPRRPLLHARVTFPVPVKGPVLAGSMRYLGLGLFMPAHPEESE